MKNISDTSNSFDLILRSVEEFEQSQLSASIQKLEPISSNTPLHFIHLEDFYENLENPTTTKSIDHFSSREQLALEKISKGLIYASIGGKGLEEYVDSIKRKAKKMGLDFTQKIYNIFRNGIIERMLEGDWYAVSTLSDWIDFGESQLKITAESTIIRLLSEIFEYDEEINKIKSSAGLKESHERCQHKFDMIQKISLRYHISKSDLLRCKLSTKSLLLLKEKKEKGA